MGNTSAHHFCQWTGQIHLPEFMALLPMLLTSSVLAYPLDDYRLQVAEAAQTRPHAQS